MLNWIKKTLGVSTNTKLSDLPIAEKTVRTTEGKDTTVANKVTVKKSTATKKKAPAKKATSGNRGRPRKSKNKGE